MKLNLKPHTVLLLVGPTGCGKSTFAESLQNALMMEGQRCQVISSDDLRRFLLQDYDCHKHDPKMLEVSEQAFKLLTTHVEAAISYPVSMPFVVVDTRGFDPEFRKLIGSIAKKHGYNFACCSFEFKNAKDYVEGLPDNEAAITEKDVSRFRRKVLPDLRSRDFDYSFKVKSRAETLEITIEDEALDIASNLINDTKAPLAIIGDSHECVDQLKELIGKIHEAHPGAQIIHIGDYLDKGGKTKEMLAYMRNRVDCGDIVVDGNHEAYLERRLKGEIDPASPEIEAQYFTALPVLQNDKEAAEWFAHIRENTVPFVRVETAGQRTLFVTHAPCETKYLGKLYFEARRAQRNLYVKDREADLRTQMSFIYSQAVGNHPLHVFGHVSHSSPGLVYRNNKVFLDTGCVHGGKLTAMVLHNDRYDFISVDGPVIEGQHKPLPDNLTRLDVVEKKFNIHDYDLSTEDMRFLNGAMRNGIKYISGTMAPAPSWDGQLEPLSAALDFFQKRGVGEVVLEPKYMGSRCQLYLYKGEPEKCFAVSRNGYRIKHVEGLDQVLKTWLTNVDGWYDGSWKEIILDGELLPWMALGKGLIEHQFRSYEHLVGAELSRLWEDEEFAKLDVAQNYDCAGRMADLATFSKTLNLYGNDAEVEFRAFNILSCDGEIIGGTPDEMFDAVNPDACFSLSLDDESGRKEAQLFFNRLTFDEGMEGVVVKPRIDQQAGLPDGVPEYMKVRNENYLTLVYGYDYKRRYDKLVNQKNISGKVAVSIRESKIARDMLTADEDKRRELIVKMISELKKEHTLDPRL